MRVKLGHTKFQRSTIRGTFPNLGLNERGRQTENWPYLGNDDRYD